MLELQKMKMDLAKLSLSENEGDTADQMRLRLEVPFSFPIFFKGLISIEPSCGLQMSSRR